MGLKLTGVVTQLVMDKWVREFRRKLDAAKVTIEILIKYVNNINVGIQPIPKGMSWSTDWLLEWSTAQQERDKSSGESDEKRSMKMIQQAADSITKGVKFTI